MKKIRLLALLILGFVATTAMAQTIRVSGVVTSAEDGQPLPGVTVLVKGTNNGTGSSADGRYSLDKVPSNGTLEFRYVGMQTQSIAVGGKTTINAVMRVDALQASEVTVTALGVRKENRALGYATTTVKGEELSRTNQVSPINALQGKVAGVQISTVGSGGVTSAPNILIRGAKSLTKNNSPIFVIDGIVMQNDERAQGATSSSDATLYGNQLKNLNPDDFETMTILKGAAATSLYGSRGANGAVVITTKSGKVRKGLGIQASYTHEWQQVYQSPVKLQNIYGMGRPSNGYEGGYNEEWQSTNSAYTAGSFGPRMDGQLMQQYYKGPGSVPEPFVAQPDNWRAFFQGGQYDNASIALTGGTNDVTYRLSYGFTKSQGVLPNNSFSRHSINFTTTGKINDIMTVDASVQYSNSNTLNPQASNPDAWGWSPTMNSAYYMNRNTDLRWVADNYIDPLTYARREIKLDGSLLGAFNRATDNNKMHNEQTIIARVGLNLQLTKWLDASANVSLNDYKYFDETKNYGGSKFREGGEYAVGYGSSGQFNGLAQIHYGDKFLDDRLEVDVRVLGEIYGNTRSYGSNKRTNGGLISPGLFNFANSKNPITVGEMGVSMSPRNNMTIGLAAIASLGWDNQVYLEVTARNDWVSSLLYPKWLPEGANNYSVFYPSVNASWVFSETFKIDPSVLSLGKIRASWAQVGMGTGAYETAKGAGGYNQKSDMTAPDNKAIIYASANNTTLPNLDLKPEIQQSIELGADIRFLDDRIGVDVTWYKTNTFNQILTIGAVPESGVGNQLINAGNIQNQGWEIQLDFNPIRTREVNWNISLNWTRNRGKIIEFHDEIKNYQLMGWVSGGGPAIYAFEGGAFGEIVAGNGYGTGSGPIAIQRDPNKPHYGKKVLFYNGTAGTPNKVDVYNYMDANNMTDYYNTTDNRFTSLGNVQPDFFFGFNTSLSYKGFDLFVQIDGRKGGNVISPVVRYSMGTGNLEATLAGRDAEHGGLARKNYKGETVYDGYIIDGVFGEKNSEVTSLKTGAKVNLNGMTMQEAVDAGHIQPMNANAFHQYAHGFADDNVLENTYVALREVTLGYNFPEKWIKHIGMQSARLSFSARNICYIYNGLSGKSNPEALTNNNPLTPYDVSGIPFIRNFALSLNVRF